MTKKRVAAALIVMAAVTAVAALQYHNNQGLKQANGCLEIHQDRMPENVHVKHFTVEDRKISVEYVSVRGAGMITCDTTEEGLLDEVATINHRIDALWNRRDQDGR